MPEIILLLIFPALGFLIAVVIGAFMGITAHGRIRQLENKLEELTRRVEQLRTRLRTVDEPSASEPVSTSVPEKPAHLHAAAAPVAVRVLAAVPAPAIAAPEPIPAPAVTPTAPVQVPVAPPAPVQSSIKVEAAWAHFEQLVAGRWMTWIGALIVFIAGAFFVHYSFTHGLVGPVGRLLIGLVIALGVGVAGDVLVQRGWRSFGQGVLGLGLMLGYAVLFGAYAFADTRVLGQLTAFAAMSAITAAGVWRSMRHDTMAVAVLATLGGLLTPVLTSSGNGSRDGLLAYLLLLDLGVLAAAAQRRWRVLDALACAGTTLMIAVWWIRAGQPAQGFAMWGWLMLFWALFAAVAVVYRIRWRAVLPAESYAVACASATAAVAGLALMVAPGWLVACGCALMAAGYTALAINASRWFGGDPLARGGLAALAVFCFSVGLPPLLHQPATLCFAWSSEAVLLWWLSQRLTFRALAVLGTMVLGAAGWKAVAAMWVLSASASPVLNLDFVFDLALPLALSACAVIGLRAEALKLSGLARILACLAPVWLALRTVVEWNVMTHGANEAAGEAISVAIIAAGTAVVARGTVLRSLLGTAIALAAAAAIRCLTIDCCTLPLAWRPWCNPAFFAGLSLTGAMTIIAWRLSGIGRVWASVVVAWWLGWSLHRELGVAIDDGTACLALRAVVWTLLGTGLAAWLRHLRAPVWAGLSLLGAAMLCVLSGYVDPGTALTPVGNPLAIAGFVIAAGALAIAALWKMDQARTVLTVSAAAWTLLIIAVDLHRSAGPAGHGATFGFFHPHALLGLAWAVAASISGWRYRGSDPRRRLVAGLFAALAAGTALLAYSGPLPTSLPLINPPCVMAIAVLAVVWRLSGFERDLRRNQWALTAAGWAWLASTAEAVAATRALELGRTGLLLGITLAWSVVGASALLVGLSAGLRPLRLAGMAMLGLTVAKLTLVDLSHLHELARIASFACAGLVLLLGSWAYHRLERRLAARNAQNP